MVFSMTVTIQLDGDLAAALERRSEQTGLPLAQVANAALRDALGTVETDARGIARARTRKTVKEPPIPLMLRAEAVLVFKQLSLVFGLALFTFVFIAGLMYGTLRMAGLTMKYGGPPVSTRTLDESRSAGTRPWTLHWTKRRVIAVWNDRPEAVDEEVEVRA